MKQILLFISVLILSANFSYSQESENEKKALTKEEKKALREKQKAKNREGEITFDEFIANWEKPRLTNDVFIDNFCSSANNMLFDYKSINDSINFIKIETFEIADEGDGITTAVKITDGNGNPRTKESVNAKWTSISLNMVGFSLESANMILSGTDFVASCISDPMRALSLAFAVKQLKQSIQALKLLTREMEKTDALIKTQKALLASAKEN